MLPSLVGGNEARVVLRLRGSAGFIDAIRLADRSESNGKLVC